VAVTTAAGAPGSTAAPATGAASPIVAAATPPASSAAVAAVPAATVPPPAAVTALGRERSAILQVLGEYQSAYRDRNVKSLLKIYPTLPRETRQSLEKMFSRDCRDVDVTFGNPQLALNAEDPTYATVTVRSTYTCQPKSAQQAIPSSMQEVFALRKLGDGWLIESAGAMDARRAR
jgi:hypothetical protein